jgi:hypothetical protein
VHGIIICRVPLLSMTCFLAAVVLTQTILICQRNRFSVKLAIAVRVSHIQKCPIITYFKCNDSVLTAHYIPDYGFAITTNYTASICSNCGKSCSSNMTCYGLCKTCSSSGTCVDSSAPKPVPTAPVPRPSAQKPVLTAPVPRPSAPKPIPTAPVP